MHDANKVQMGVVTKSGATIDNLPGNIVAGRAVSKDSDGNLSLAVSAGPRIGISLGKDGSSAGRTAVVRKGLGVPLEVTSGFTPTIGAQVTVSDTTGMAAGSGTAINATYASAEKSAGGLAEDGVSVAVDVVLIDFPGGV